MSHRARLLSAKLFVVFLFAWPAVHIILSLFFGLNSWKLGGWGMYAMMFPNYIGVHAYLLEPGAQLSKVDPDPVVAVYKATVVSPEGPREIDLDNLAPELERELDHILERIRVFQGDRYMRRMAALLRGIPPGLSRQGDVLYILSIPRLNVFDRYTYTDNVVYLVRNGRVVSLGTYSTDSTSPQQLFAEIEEKITPHRLVASIIPARPQELIGFQERARKARPRAPAPDR